MAFVHPFSEECFKSELDLFSVPMTQTSIESGSYVEYNPISSISDGTPVEFVISGTGQEYIDLANTQLYVKVDILKGDNARIDDKSEVAPVNLLLHSLLRSGCEAERCAHHIYKQYVRLSRVLGNSADVR